MPELPEIETVCRGIEDSILKQKITAVTVRNHNLRWPVPQNLAQVLRGKSIQKIHRRGKYILLKTQTGTLIIHLGMSGTLQTKTKSPSYAKHDHVIITFANKLTLCYNDPRRFGAVLWTKQDPALHSLLKNLGPEPFSRDFTPQYLLSCAKRHRCSIKQFLMNNKIVVGIGNIYVTEVLFAAKINPTYQANKLSLKDCQLLTKKIKQILHHAIKYKGTTIRDYSDSQGKSGKFQNKLKAYGRQGKPCLNCKTILKQIRIGQRSSVFCPQCQKARRQVFTTDHHTT